MSFIELNCRSKALLDLAEAFRTEPLSLELGDTEVTAAEGAGRVIFGEYDSVALDEDLDGIVVRDVHLLSHFLGDNYSAELVDVSDNSCSFHLYILLEN